MNTATTPTIGPYKILPKYSDVAATIQKQKKHMFVCELRPGLHSMLVCSNFDNLNDNNMKQIVMAAVEDQQRVAADYPIYIKTITGVCIGVFGVQNVSPGKPMEFWDLAVPEKLNAFLDWANMFAPIAMKKQSVVTIEKMEFQTAIASADTTNPDMNIKMQLDDPMMQLVYLQIGMPTSRCCLGQITKVGLQAKNTTQKYQHNENADELINEKNTDTTSVFKACYSHHSPSPKRVEVKLSLPPKEQEQEQEGNLVTSILNEKWIGESEYEDE